MPIPLYIIGAKCKYTFSAQNLPPGLTVQNNFIVGKVSELGSWEVTLTAFPSNLKYPVLQKTFTVVVGEKITREIIQDLVIYPEITGNIVNLSLVETAIVNDTQGNIRVFSDAHIDILGQARIRCELNTQQVFSIDGFSRASFILDNCLVSFCELRRTLITIVEPWLTEFAVNFAQNNSSSQSQANYFNLGDVNNARFLNQSQVNLLTSAIQVISTITVNRSEVLVRGELSVISTLFVNRSQCNLLTDSRQPLELIESKVRNLSQVNLST